MLLKGLDLTRSLYTRGSVMLFLQETRGGAATSAGGPAPSRRCGATQLLAPRLPRDIW